VAQTLAQLALTDSFLVLRQASYWMLEVLGQEVSGSALTQRDSAFGLVSYLVLALRLALFAVEEFVQKATDDLLTFVASEQKGSRCW